MGGNSLCHTAIGFKHPEIHMVPKKSKICRANAKKKQSTTPDIGQLIDTRGLHPNCTRLVEKEHKALHGDTQYLFGRMV